MSLPETFERIRNRSTRVPGWIRGPLLLAGVVPPIYWMVTYSGPYKAITEMQLDFLPTGFYPFLSLLTPMAALLVPILVLVQFLARFFPAGP